MAWLPHGEKISKIFIRFGATHERDRRIDGHCIPAIAALMHSIARKKKPVSSQPTNLLKLEFRYFIIRAYRDVIK